MNSKQINKTLSFTVSDMVAKKLIEEEGITNRNEMQYFLERRGFSLMSVQGNSIYNSYVDIINGFKKIDEIPNIEINF